MNAQPAARVIDGLESYYSSMATAVAPRRHMTVSEWADTNRVLSTKSSSEPGPWRTKRVPYLREIMDCLSPSSPVRTVVFKKGSQVAGTEAGLNWIGYTAAEHPGPMLIVLPTIDVRKKWSKQRLLPLIEETPALNPIFSRVSRDSSTSADMRDYAGGFLVLAGANSAASLASMPIRDVYCDEVDRFPWMVGREGDPLTLIRQRQSTFRRRKLFLCSTPTWEGASIIDREYQETDMRQYVVPCPHCERGLVLRWKQMQWDKGVTRAWYVCEHCGSLIFDHDKTRMLESGFWRPQRNDVSRQIRGYHLSALYSPVGLGYTFLELAREWVKAQTDEARKITFVNTKLGECWRGANTQVQPYRLVERAEVYSLRHAPAEVLMATAGVDTQDNRLALQILGWGFMSDHLACWVLDWVEIPGHPADPQLWDRLTEILLRPIERGGKNEGNIRVSSTAIDTGGHYTQDVYRYLRLHAAPRLMGIKGANRPGRPVLSQRPSLVDVSVSGKLIKHGVRLWTVGTDTAKHTLISRLGADTDLPAEQRNIHFSQDLDEDYYRQLTAERFNPRRNRWELFRGRRNEALDTWVYAYTAANHPEIRVETMRATDWERLRKNLDAQATSDSDKGKATQRKKRKDNNPRSGNGNSDDWSSKW